ncbi:four helix bundle protein [Candidatus Falkowbacteria bacterium]|jgi:four helix bundle protein|nr:four helix bundle protein [Candidatus Falkowbacteria bacterium]MBT5503457.1 four helix bundle protein [Candidatus Falkowbacteria bacterium]MBT6574307.1 four helix bundle protein [Candidatus Falkowbacteria bacterium]MBT7348252.1 four helix bundle protein [Candidatus Falkowbacteria bacterium]MBT7500231.1 four helix bundle protein [Candidatus Falkowbacteria bacterium]
MNKINNYYDLKAWQRAYKFTLKVYEVTSDFPAEEKFGLISQIRRASISITANIAEGFSRYYFKDKIRFYYQARGSLSEVQSFLLVSRGLNILESSFCEELVNHADEVKRLINGLIKSIQKQL